MTLDMYHYSTGLLAGYVLYDCSHYWLHHSTIASAESLSQHPSWLYQFYTDWFLRLKRQHMKHHFQCQDTLCNLGISPPACIVDWFLATQCAPFFAPLLKQFKSH